MEVRAGCGCIDFFVRALFERSDSTQEAHRELLQLETRIQHLQNMQVSDEETMRAIRQEYAAAEQNSDTLAMQRLEPEHEDYYDKWLLHQQGIVVLRAAKRRMSNVISTADQVTSITRTTAIADQLIAARTADEMRKVVQKFKDQGDMLEDVQAELESISSSASASRRIKGPLLGHAPVAEDAPEPEHPETAPLLEMDVLPPKKKKNRVRPAELLDIVSKTPVQT